LLHPLPYPDPDRLVIVQEDLPRYSLRNTTPTPQDFAEFTREQTCFSGMEVATGTTATVTGDGPPEDVPALRITAGAFPMLGVVPTLGGLFTAEEEQAGRDRVAILSDGLWKRRYGADRSIVGKNSQINRESYRVAGVIRPIFDYRVTADVWMPLAFEPAEIRPGTRGLHYIDTIGAPETWRDLGAGAGTIPRHRLTDCRKVSESGISRSGLYGGSGAARRAAGRWVESASY
jgi:hypothetical protein